MFVNDNNTQHLNDNPVGCVVGKKGEAMLKDVPTSFVRTYDCFGPFRLHFTATEIAEYASLTNRLTCFATRDGEKSSRDKLLWIWHNILQVSGRLGKPESGSLYSIDARVVERSNTGPDRVIYRQRGIATAYWLRYQGVLVYKTGDMHTEVQDDALPDELRKAIKLIPSCLDTFGHDLVPTLGAWSGCRIEDWPAYDPSAPIPDEALPEVIQVQEIAIK